MASTYNGSVANLVDPLANSPLNSPSHAGQHTEINDALQTLGTYTDFTPTWTNLTVGNATQTFRYTQYNKMVHFYGQFRFGTTSSVTGLITLTLPVTARLGTSIFYVAGIGYEDSGTALVPGFAHLNSNVVNLRVANVAGTYPTEAALSSTVPFTWATNDKINVDILYEAA